MGEDPTTPTGAEVSHRLGRYELVLPIAADERATVSLARVHGSDLPYYAIKVWKPPTPTFGSVLREEAGAIAGFRHRHVVVVTEAGESERGPFVAMEYIPGDSLAGLVRGARGAGASLPRAVALRLVTDLLAGLHAVHEHGGGTLFHRGLSARDVLVGTDGIARVGGWGVAAASAGVPLLGEPWRGQAPEQRASGPIDRRCDVWAAGAIAWEVLSGVELRPDAIGAAGPPDLRTVATDLPASVAVAVARALRTGPEQRTPDAASFARELEDAARASGLVANAADVAVHVRRLAQPKLAERAARFGEARRLFGARPPSIPDVRTMIGGIGAPSFKRLPLADLPSHPALHDDGASELRIAIVPDARADRADAMVLGPPSAPPPPVEEDGVILRSPLAIGEAAPAHAPGGIAAPASIQSRLTAWFAPPWTTQKISILAGASCGIFGFVLVIAVISGRGRPPKTATSLDGGAVPTSALASASAGPAATPDPSPPASASAEAGDTTELHLKANATIAQVVVNGRPVDAITPAPSVNVDLAPGDAAGPVRLVVTSSDGRVATLTTNAGDADVEVVFGDKPKTPTRRPGKPKRRK